MVRRFADRDEVITEIGELFREHGYPATSLSLITERTGLGKGSLYHLFPGGKPEMGEAVLTNIHKWFEDNVFLPLIDESDPQTAISHMFEAVTTYFRSGRRICLIGAMALDASRDPFAQRISDYFQRWLETLALALNRAGLLPDDARQLAREIVLGIQGALVLARAIDDDSVFIDEIGRLRKRSLTLPQR